MAAGTAGTPLGKQVDNFSLPDFHGKAYSLDDYKDKVVVLAFIGTECPLAKSYAPRLRDLAAEFEKQGVAFLGIDANLQDSLTEIGAFARVNGITFPMLKDNNNEIADRVGAVRTPEVFLLDRQRVIRYWGRIDDQYGFKTGAGYVKPKLAERNLADAISGGVGRQGSQPPGRQGRRLLYRPRIENQAARRRDLLEAGRPHHAEPLRGMPSPGRSRPLRADFVRRSGRLGRNDPRSRSGRSHAALVCRSQVRPLHQRCPLSDEEKQQISTWVENGCPKGDAKDLPEPRKFVEGWQMGEPDQVFYMRDKPFTVPAEGVVDYQFFTVDPGWTDDKWIQATEARPGNRAVVHHIIVFVQSNGGDVFASGGVGGYAPGTTPNTCPPGTAIRVPAGSKLVFQMHYTPNGTQQEDRSMIGVRFADPKTVKKMVRGAWWATWPSKSRPAIRTTKSKPSTCS